MTGKPPVRLPPDASAPSPDSGGTGGPVGDRDSSRDASRADVDGAESVGDVIRAAITSSVWRLADHVPVALLGQDTEGVHQARVATRRLRSDLRTFRDFVDGSWAGSLRGELKWLGRELGGARDAEVLLDRLRASAATLPTDDRHAAERVVARLATRREEAREEMLAALGSPRFARLAADLAAAERAPALLPNAATPARLALAGLMDRPWQRLCRAVDALGDEPPDAALHEVRIRTKRCRYAAEAVAPVAGRRARQLARALAAVQDVLGEHQDSVVARRWLRDVASDSPADEVYAAGVLSGLELARSAKARAAFPDAWSDAATERLHGWW